MGHDMIELFPGKHLQGRNPPLHEVHAVAMDTCLVS